MSQHFCQQEAASCTASRDLPNTFVDVCCNPAACRCQVNTLHLHTNQLHLASSASDGSVAVWDVRSLAAASGSSSKGRKQQQGKAAKPLCSVGHNKSSQGACWCPDGRWAAARLVVCAVG